MPLKIKQELAGRKEEMVTEDITVRTVNTGKHGKLIDTLMKNYHLIDPISSKENK